MAKQLAPDGTEYEYDANDPGEVARVAALCEPSVDEKRRRAKAAFEAASPAERAAATANAPAVQSGFSAEDVRKIIAEALAQAKAQGSLHNASGVPSATEPVAEAVTPVEGSQG